MTVYFVSRHAGARDWLARQGLAVDQQIAHLDPAGVIQGDTVIGTLPVNLAAEVCARGARYVHLSLQLPLDRRGQELTADELEAHGARLQAYTVSAV
ncbi:MAG TPA: CRISPR-associated protein Csx16 [Gammaproteobacteria bacterium]|nr:CRISPR-associated protein Csx16 [Gammaproteobacteria bacterium]